MASSGMLACPSSRALGSVRDGILPCSRRAPAHQISALASGATRSASSVVPRLAGRVTNRRSFAAVRATGTNPRVLAAMASDSKKVLVPVADGCEEMEAVITIDVLVRAGAAVTVASVDQQTVKCSRGVKLQADMLIADASKETYDLIAVPGGMPGAEHFRDCEALMAMIREQKAAGRLYAAICASPAVVFEHHGILEGSAATSHPGFQDRLANQGSVKERVVEVGNLTTSQGPGTAFEFALSLVKQLYGEEKMREIAGPMCMYPTPILD